MNIMDKSLRDLKWLYETLSKGGKTSEFYEAQAPIIGEVLKHWEVDQCKAVIEKYKWHDLRKNPDDFPKDERLLILVIKHSYSEIDGYRDYTFGYFSNDAGKFVIRNHACDYYEAIAWKEIEPFEESAE